MATAIQSAPDETWQPAGQRLIYTLSTNTSPIPDGFKFIVQVEENGTEIAKLYLSQNTNSVAHFDLSEVVKGRVAVDSEKYGTTSVIHSLNSRFFSKSNGNVNRYEVKVGEFNGSSESTDEDNQTVYLIDGYEQISDGLHPSFADFYGTASTVKTWLTDRVPDADNVIEIPVDIEETGVAAFINTDDTGSTLANVEIKVYDTSGTLADTLTYAIDLANGAQSPAAAASSNTDGTLCYAYVYPSSYLALTNALNAVSGGWGHYDVRPLATTALRGSVLRFVNKCNSPKYDTVQIAWANTRGGWDYLRFNGKKQKTVTREEKTYRKIIGDYDAATFRFSTAAREVQPYQLEAMERYQLNGILTIEELTLMQYCMRSKNVMARIEGTWVPVTIQTNSMQIEEETVSKVFVTSFEVELAQALRC